MIGSMYLYWHSFLHIILQSRANDQGLDADHLLFIALMFFVQSITICNDDSHSECIHLIIILVNMLIRDWMQYAYNV